VGRPKIRTAELRDDVLRGALDAFEREGPQAVSARRVAAAAGTSTAALYELFGDKAGLVRAVYLEGFAELQRALDAVAPDDDARRSLVRLLAAAREFARQRPMLFELMYSRPFAEFSPGAADREAAVEVYRTIVGAVRRWLRDVDSAASATEAAHVLVAAHRGFVLTELGGVAGRSAASVERRYRLGVDVVLDGILAAHPTRPVVR
jgi:AcrR family transcriptional regulator